MTIALLLALLIGLSLATFGSGGSIITLPVLVYVAGVPVTQAVAMSLLVVGVTAAVGSYLLGRRHGIDGRAAAVFAVTGGAGAFFGAHLTPLVPGTVLLLLFGLVMIAAGTHLLRRGARSSPQSGRRTWRCVAVGLAIGALTGFLGVGGGFLIVPALLIFAGLDIKRAVPTSLAVIACNAAGGFAGQLRTAPPDWTLTALFLCAALIGLGGGTVFAKRIAANTLLTLFAWTILVFGAVIAARNAAVLLL